MRQVLVTMIFVAVSFCAVSQEDTPKPKVSDESLTTEQIAVYRAVLKDCLKGSDGVLNLADTTEPLGQSDRECLKGNEREGTRDPAPVIHRLVPSLVVNTKIVLVDSERQQRAVKENDPQNLIKKGIDDHEKITEEQLDQSVKQAFRSGLFTLSEIVFDKDHRRAVVAYSFVCGMLCGRGNTLVLKKIGKHWRVTERCSGWIS